jgi:dynein heavy chain
MYGGKELPKQRGIYSEILTTEDSKHLQEVSTFGPPKAAFLEYNRKQRMPRALGLRKKPEAVLAQPPLSATSEQSAKQPMVGKDYFRDPNVNEGFYSRKRAGVADVDPKVMEPFEPIPGRPPRKVVIDRQRKLFASLDIEELLLELGIDYRNPAENPADWLPLEPFDDTEYDCRMPEEWISFGDQEDGSF